MPLSLRATGAVLLVLATTWAGTGCAQKTHAQARVEPPAPLEVPPPPARLIIPPQPEVPEPVEETQPPSPARPRPNRPAPRPETKPETARQDPTTATEPPPAVEPPPAQETKPSRPPDAAGVAAVRQQMARASQNLGQVNYAGLSNDMKVQYDTANRFLALADQALREGNLLFASTLVDKAGAIASLLTGR